MQEFRIVWMHTPTTTMLSAFWENLYIQIKCRTNCSKVPRLPRFYIKLSREVIIMASTRTYCQENLFLILNFSLTKFEGRLDLIDRLIPVSNWFRQYQGRVIGKPLPTFKPKTDPVIIIRPYEKSVPMLSGLRSNASLISLNSTLLKVWLEYISNIGLYWTVCRYWWENSFLLIQSLR